MHEKLISEIVTELRTRLSGRFLGKIFQLGPQSIAIDFGIKGEYLFVSVDPSSPRLFLIRRRLKELEKSSIPLQSFAQHLRAKLTNARLVDIEKIPNDRIVRMLFQSDLEIGSPVTWTLVIQLTGKAANLLLVNGTGYVVDALRPPKGEGQNPGEIYQAPPARPDRSHSELPLLMNESPSAAAAAFFEKLDATKAFDTHANRLRSRLQQQLRQKRKLASNLQTDLATHGDPEAHKRIGDLLLANIGTAIRRGRAVEINDYYAEGAPSLSIEVDENTTLQEEATRRFRQFTKAKRARDEIVERLALLDTEIANLEKEQKELSEIITSRDETALIALDPESTAAKTKVNKRAEPARLPGVRHYVSSDGYEILVGRAARDNDNLTFHIARPNDLWLHAADYPGSHVIVRNPTRKEVPQRTMIEAAQLAGKFSQAADDTKVVVHYTPRKFLSKPKRSAPGLVRMSTFKSITVEPKEAVSRLR
ncbi:MAG TPA: NFACT family protein [Pyrinomonadaceae bacterium]|nr:NFACT family protein [Pyrinomonadaceae bacterium]